MTSSIPNTPGARRRRITGATLLAAAATIAVGAFGSAAPANADAGGPYVVIAYSPVNGAHGWANNRATFQQALDDALGNCIGFGGGTSCQLGAWAHNSCAAVISDAQVGDFGHWSGRGGEPDTIGAEQAALYANGGGQAVLSRCATGNQGSGT